MSPSDEAGLENLAYLHANQLRTHLNWVAESRCRDLSLLNAKLK